MRNVNVIEKTSKEKFYKFFALLIPHHLRRSTSFSVDVGVRKGEKFLSGAESRYRLRKSKEEAKKPQAKGGRLQSSLCLSSEMSTSDRHKQVYF
jgi:hypothetical protein